jgi:hypothetical protein
MYSRSARNNYSLSLVHGGAITVHYSSTLINYYEGIWFPDQQKKQLCRTWYILYMSLSPCSRALYC